MKATINNSQKIKRLTIIALFCAMSFLVSVILPIKVSFLTLDFKDCISAICGMFFGPVSGLFCAVAVPFIEFTYSDTGVYGLIMNLISSIAFVGTSTLIYRFRKKISGAVIALESAVFATVAVMMIANLYITPFYMRVTQETVVGLIPKLLLPFNLIKSVLNAGMVMLLYKPVSKMLKRMGVSKSFYCTIENESQASSKSNSVLVTVISASVVIGAFLVLFLVLGGSF